MVDGSILWTTWQDEAVHPVRYLYPFWVCEENHPQVDPANIEELLQATVLDAKDTRMEDKDTVAEDENSEEGRRQEQGQTPMEDVPRTITVITTRIEIRRGLADTGASISATGIRSILHKFQYHSDYQIKGYDGQVTRKRARLRSDLQPGN